MPYQCALSFLLAQTHLHLILKGDFISKELKEPCCFFPSLWVAAKTPTFRKAGAFPPTFTVVDHITKPPNKSINLTVSLFQISFRSFFSKTEGLKKIKKNLSSLDCKQKDWYSSAYTTITWLILYPFPRNSVTKP